VLGTEDLFKYIKKYKLQLDCYYNNILGKYPRKSWDSFIDSKNQHLCTPDAIDLLSKMLVYERVSNLFLLKQARILPCEAMQHPYFDPIRKS